MDDKEKSFLGELYYVGGEATASIGFQKAYTRHERHDGFSTITILHETVYELYASSYPGNKPALIYFRFINNGEYVAYIRDPNFHTGKHLFINNGVISVSDIPTEVNYFSFKQNGQRIQIHETQEKEISAEFVCKDGGIEFYNVENTLDVNRNFTAQIVSKDGEYLLKTIQLKIIERNVDWLSSTTKT